MRSRNIKPGFFKNDLLAECDPLARILFTGLWCMADREGRVEYRTKKIKVELLPYDNCNIEKLINQLTSKNFITVYSISGCNYIEINNFLKHQTPHIKEQASTIPAPDKNQSNTSQESLIPDSLNLIPDSGLRIPDAPENPGAKLSNTKSKKYKTPLPDNFTISQSVRTWAKDKGHSRLEEHLEAFKAKCRANGYQYIDWDSAFMEAIRADWAKLQQVGGNGNGTDKRGHSAREPGIPKEYRPDIPPEPTGEGAGKVKALVKQFVNAATIPKNPAPYG